MSERYRPRINDAVWVEGRNPAWYADVSDRYMNAEVISIAHDGALVKYFDDGSVEHFDNDYFTNKTHHPDDNGWGVWKIHY